MPFTPFHFGPALFIYGIFVFLDPIALIYGAILIDLEPAIVMFLRLNYPLHGFMHSIVGVFLLLPIAYVATLITRRLLPDIDFFFTSRRREFMPRLIIASTLIGSFSHILLDSFLYPEMNLAWPLPYWNPLLNTDLSLAIYEFCGVTLIIAIPLIVLRRYGLFQKLFHAKGAKQI
jgi:membrane-bound metal-dependent hydrolase YbcI (DUF457 family)